MVLQQSQSPAYWTTALKITRADIDYLLSQFLEDETPLTTQELALRLIRHRIDQEETVLRKQIARGELFQPKNTYEVGQELIFPAFGYALGKVVGQRAGQNSDYGEFTVIEVEFENKQRREIASTFKPSHLLNLDEAGGQTLPTLQSASPESILEQYSEHIIDELEAKLIDQEDAIFFAGKWFLQSLLVEVNVGHLHLAEAILDINEGGPLPPSTIRKEIDLAKEVKNELAEFSLNVAMSSDERFDDVGPAGQVHWFLHRIEPNEVLVTPSRLVYKPVEYDRSILTEELLTLERELDDELSEFEPPDQQPREAMLTLIYPHRRVGTLPLTSRVWNLFPTAITSPRVRVTMIDAQDGMEFAGWIVRDSRYVFGMNDFYRKHKLPIGAYVTLRATDEPARLMIDFEAHRPRTEYIRLAMPTNGRIVFQNFKRSIGAGYDELLILGAEDLEGVDAIWTITRERKRGLVEIMKDLMPELSRLTPQNTVHAKTLYSAVNVVRRCPPGPIFSALVARPEFEHVGGPYWRLSS